jgi:hypothetical protein
VARCRICVGIRYIFIRYSIKEVFCNLVYVGIYAGRQCQGDLKTQYGNMV